MVKLPGRPRARAAKAGAVVEQRAVQLPTEETAPEGWLRGIRFSGFTVLMLALLVVAIIVLAPNLRIFIEQRAQIAQLEAELAESEERVDELTDDVARWEDPAYIVAEARDRLYFIYPGDQSYLIIDDGQTQQPVSTTPITDQIVPTEVDWLQAVLSSVFTAGLTEAPPADLETTGTGG